MTVPEPSYTTTYAIKVMGATWNYALDDRGLKVDAALRHDFVPWEQVRGVAFGAVHGAPGGVPGGETAQLLVSVQEPGRAKPRLKRYNVRLGDPESVRLAEELARRLGPRWLGVGELNPITRQLGHSTAWAAAVAIGLVAAILVAIVLFAVVRG
ncbi:MAG: hypothetical protein JXB32_15505 [Deltaproteobacteria bacterium]|nr:hypothetical protein [Deltaproteobacteria bacterium]